MDDRGPRRTPLPRGRPVRGPGRPGAEPPPRRDRRLLAADGRCAASTRSGAPEVAPLTEAEVERRRSAERARAGWCPGSGALAGSPWSTPASWWWSATTRGACCGGAARPGSSGWPTHSGSCAGSAWTEGNVGTNAIGTGLVLGGAGADPGRGALRGVPHPVGLRGRPRHGPVDRPQPGRGRRQRPSREPAPGRARAGRDGRPARVDRDPGGAAGPARAAPRRTPPPSWPGSPARRWSCDRDGHLAAATGLRAPERVALPDGLVDGEAWLPRLGDGAAWSRCPTAGCCAWRTPRSPNRRRLVLDLGPRARGAGRPARPGTGSSGSRPGTPRSSWRWCRPARRGVPPPTWRPTCSRRRDAWSPCGPRCRGCAGCSVACCCTQPYRVAPHLESAIRLPADPRTLLPGSSAPVVVRLREHGQVGTGGAGT